MYDKWERQGFIHTTEGNVVHYGFIDQFITKLGERFNIREIAYDRWNATMMVQTLEDDGFNMVPFGQGFRDMSPPTKELMRIVLERKLNHGGHESEKTIVKKLNDLVLAWRRGEKPIHPFCPIMPSDVAKIVHVIDMDGTFIPEDCVVLGDVGAVEYNENSIRYMDRDFIIGRNRKKAKAIRKLLTIKAIDNVPYDVFFMSCNMDHVLFDTRNPASKTKGFNARTFASKCKKPEDLEKSIFAESVCCNSTLTESWEFIQEDCNSLNRHTNLNLLLQELKA